MNLHPTSTGPVGTSPSCAVNPAPAICYLASRSSGGDDTPANGVYTLSPFNADGIASGQMTTLEGIVPLVVQYRQ